MKKTKLLKVAGFFVLLFLGVSSLYAQNGFRFTGITTPKDEVNTRLQAQIVSLKQTIQANPIGADAYTMGKLDFYTNVVQSLAEGTAVQDALTGNFVAKAGAANGFSTPNALNLDPQQMQNLYTEVINLLQ